MQSVYPTTPVTKIDIPLNNQTIYIKNSYTQLKLATDDVDYG